MIVFNNYCIRFLVTTRRDSRGSGGDSRGSGGETIPSNGMVSLFFKPVT